MRTPIAAILSSAGAPSKPAGLSGRSDPDADAVLARFADDAERAERVDQPAFQRGDIGAHVWAAALEVEHDIGHPLPRPMVGILPAPSGPMDGKARVQQVAVPGAGAGGVERRDARRARPARVPRPPRSPRRAPPSRAPRRHSRSGPALRAIRTGGAGVAGRKGACGARREWVKAGPASMRRGAARFP